MTRTKTKKSEYLKANKYRGIIIEIFPAIQYPLDTDICYRAETSYVYVENGWSKEIDFSAYGYSEADAEEKIRREIDHFMESS